MNFRGHIIESKPQRRGHDYGKRQHVSEVEAKNEENSRADIEYADCTGDDSVHECLCEFHDINSDIIEENESRNTCFYRRKHRTDSEEDEKRANKSSSTFNFEYLDHTADIIVHSWGQNLKECLENGILGMFNYMSPIERIKKSKKKTIKTHGFDILDLVFHFFDECLFLYGSEYYFASNIEIKHFKKRTNACNRDPENQSVPVEFIIEADLFGENFDPRKHVRGTEIKAITMHDMRLSPCLLIAVDDMENEHKIDEKIKTNTTSREHLQSKEFDGVELFILVDI